jgi:hypothetical protein
MKDEKPAFSIHYDICGKIINVTSDDLKVMTEKGQELPPGVNTDEVVTTTMIAGNHNPRCRYIWRPGWGWVWVCW